MSWSNSKSCYIGALKAALADCGWGMQNKRIKNEYPHHSSGRLKSYSSDLNVRRGALVAVQNVIGWTASFGIWRGEGSEGQMEGYIRERYECPLSRLVMSRKLVGSVESMPRFDYPLIRKR